jgi:hypothetical protein
MRLNRVLLLGLLIQLGPATARAADPGLLAQAMDKQLAREHVEFNGTLPQAVQTFAGLAAVPITVDDSVYDALPWGQRTTFRATFQHQTLRQALTAICRKLGLEFTLTDQAIELRPLPALRRIGRRCTVEELAALDLLSRTPLAAAQVRISPARLSAMIDTRLAGSDYAVEDRVFGDKDSDLITVARNSTLLDALDEIHLQTDATWYPSGKSIIILKKVDQIHMQLTRRITVRFDNQDVSQVLLDLSQRSGIEFQIDPGAVRKIDPKFRTIRLVLDNASVEQGLQSICGFTGLAYEVTEGGVRIWYAMAPATQPQTRSTPN